ncbi:hypothetical protein [Halorubellus sp. PRR65]|uniref:hypothetical protein n=1 Tax=Halorubellus sp. PRR65 TaxID=3098148 RepID=UPI002B2620A4|nr:hypothetical protein [Halorubellus sp. PRR65]
MRRRALLASTAVVALGTSTAGCVDTEATDTDQPRATDGTSGRDATASTAPTDDGPRTVEVGDAVDLGATTAELGSLSLQSTFVERQWPMWDAHGRDDHAFVVVRLSGADRARALARDPPVGVRVDGERYDDSDAYSRTDGGRPVEFAATIPTGDDVDSAALVLRTTTGDARYPLDDDLLATLRAPPELTVTPDVPDVVTDGPLQYELVVENTGDGPGTLVATSTHDAIHDKWWTRGETVAPGDTASLTFEPYAPTEGDGYELEIVLDWGLDSVTRTVTIENDEGTTTD